MIGAIILAAGEGKRMKSNRAKVLHEIDGRAMVEYVIDSARELDPVKIILVVGNRMDQIITHLQKARVIFAVQTEQKGTADAVLTAQMPFTNFDGELFVLCGDMPLVRATTLHAMLDYHRRTDSSATVMTGILDDPAQYGRIVRDEAGGFVEIIEFADGDEDIRAIKEVNSGAYVFNSADLWPSLMKIGAENAQGEYYLTDVMTVLKEQGKTVAAYTVTDSSELLGINTPEQLKLAETALTKRKMLEGT